MSLNLFPEAAGKVSLGTFCGEGAICRRNTDMGGCFLAVCFIYAFLTGLTGDAFFHKVNKQLFTL
jgi:hypothetical protein